MSLAMPNEEFIRAKKIAFQFLKVRNRSEKEIRRKFIQKKINAEVTTQTLDYLKKLDLVNDRRFARDWITMRLGVSYGLKRIFFELKEKGIAKSIIDDVLTEIKVDRPYNEEDTITCVVQKRMQRYKNLEPEKAKRRMFEYLARRGFSLDKIKSTVEKL